MKNNNFSLCFVWFSLVVVTYTLIKSINSDVDAKIYERIEELFFLCALHFIVEFCYLINKTEYGCLESSILCVWYFVWYIGSVATLVSNKKINDLCTGVILGHLITYTILLITYVCKIILECRKSVMQRNNNGNNGGEDHLIDNNVQNV
jgi:hypothetical protein